MRKIIGDFSRLLGPIKPMNGLTNGPVVSRGVNNFDSYRALRVPFVRNHDASFFAAYGGSHTVDVTAVFPDFDADENDPESYDFTLTDAYLDTIESAGTRTFYRLGNRIEHEIKKYGAHPPKDFAKWARICEHIIRHETEGWAEGFFRDMPYWEIWNEPDLGDPCWTGTAEAFFRFYETAARHLKGCFPHLHIGGPAVTLAKSVRHDTSTPFLEDFFTYLTRDPADPVPLDFLSYHRYGTDPRLISHDSRFARSLLDRYGYTRAECILNEWNYVRGWSPEELVYSHRVSASLKGAAFDAACMAEGQSAPPDMLVYYDASIGSVWNGLWDPLAMEPQKPYYAFRAFSELAGLGTQIFTEGDGPEYFCLGAVNPEGTCGRLLLTRYRDAEDSDGKGIPPEEVAVHFVLPDRAKTYTVSVSLLDGDHDLTEVSRRGFDRGEGYFVLPVKMYDTLLITFRVR